MHLFHRPRSSIECVFPIKSPTVLRCPRAKVIESQSFVYAARGDLTRIGALQIQTGLRKEQLMNASDLTRREWLKLAQPA